VGVHVGLKDSDLEGASSASPLWMPSHPPPPPPPSLVDHHRLGRSSTPANRPGDSSAHVPQLATEIIGGSNG
jgi:hypothetical protein